MFVRLFIITIMSGALYLAGCSFPEDPGCVDDHECRGERTCVDGRCVGFFRTPEPTPPPDMDVINEPDFGECRHDSDCPEGICQVDEDMIGICVPFCEATSDCDEDEVCVSMTPDDGLTGLCRSAWSCSSVRGTGNPSSCRFTWRCGPTDFGLRCDVTEDLSTCVCLREEIEVGLFTTNRSTCQDQDIPSLQRIANDYCEFRVTSDF